MNLEHDRAPIRVEIDDNDSEDGDEEEGGGDVNASKSASLAKKKKSTKASKSVGGSVRSFGSSTSGGSILGFQPVPVQYLEQNVEFLARWLNFYVLPSSIESFPNSIIEHQGAEIFELITFLSGKTNFPFKYNLDHLAKRNEKVTRI